MPDMGEKLLTQVFTVLQSKNSVTSLLDRITAVIEWHKFELNNKYKSPSYTLSLSKKLVYLKG